MFWEADKVTPLFYADRAVPVDVPHDGQWHDYTQKLAIRLAADARRIDPAAGPGRVEINGFA